MAEISDQADGSAGLDEVDLGFDLGIGDPGTKEIDLGFGLNTNEDSENEIVTDSEKGDSIVPSMLKYLDQANDGVTITPEPQASDIENISGLNDSEDNPLTSLISVALGNVETDDTTVEISLTESLDVGQGSVGQEIRSADEVIGQMSVPMIIVDEASECSSETSEEESVDETEEEKSVEQATEDIEEEETVEKSIEDTEKEKSIDVEQTVENMKEHTVSDNVIAGNLSTENSPPKEVEPSTVEVSNNVMADNVLVTNLKQHENEDEDEFDFELPQKTEVQFDVSNIKRDMADLDTRMNILDVFSEWAPVSEPLEQLQQQVQKTLTDATQARIQLTSIQKLSEDIPPQHAEYNHIRSWSGTCEYRLREVQRLAQIKLSQVLEAINDRQAQEAAMLQEAYERGEDTALHAAEAEWDAVQSIIPEIGDEFGDGRRKVKVATIPVIGYSDALDLAESTFNLSQYESVIKTTVQRKGFSGFMHKLFGTKLHKNLHDEQKLVFCLAACPFQEDIPCHWHILHTIYKRLTGSKVDAPRFGSHWENIGFQGNDPATDLRGSGILGLLQLLYIVTDPMLYPLVKDMYILSRHEVQNFPFSIMGINITCIVLQTFREENLHKECNRRKSVIDVINDMYIATWFHLYTIWKNKHMSIRDTGFVMKDVENAAKKRPAAMISAVNAYLAQNNSTASKSLDNGEPIKFEAVCDLEEN